MNRLQLILLCVLVALFHEHVKGLPQGAPEGACITMMPRHNAQAQDGTPPYVIQVNKSYYSQNSTIRVYIRACGKDDIGGFLIEARQKGATKPLGHFTMIPKSDTKYVNCTSMGAETEESAVTHTKPLSARMLDFEWTSYGKMTTGNIYFQATIAKDQPTFWINVKSVELEEMTPGKNYSTPSNPQCDSASSVVVNLAFLIFSMSAILLI